MPLYSHKILPAAAEEYLQKLALIRSPNNMKFTRASIRHFHRFLAQAKIDIHSLTPEKLKAFDEDLQQHGQRLVTRKTVFYNVRRYLMTLEKNDLIPESLIKLLFPKYHPEFNREQAANLPELADQFLAVIAATHKPSTVNGYRAGLRAFYRLHWKREKIPYRITREDIDNFLIDMKNRDLRGNQRITRILHIRRYLDWLHDHGKLKMHPDDLIKRSDFPRTQQHLPRPFPVDVDLEIQKRLGASNDPAYLGLLVVRRCGLRIGELCNLTLDCIQEDLVGNHFLKVPLGKLDKERVIPLDLTTVEIIEKIKRTHKIFPGRENSPHYLVQNPKGGRKRTRHYFGITFQEVTEGLVIPGPVTLHRLRHSFATSLLSAGLSITTLKKLLGHHDIRMTLGYAAVTQETVRNEYFAALSKVQSRYEVASYPLKTPDLREGVNRSLNEARRLVNKIARDKKPSNPEKLQRLLYRLNILRHEFSVFLKE